MELTEKYGDPFFPITGGDCISAAYIQGEVQVRLENRTFQSELQYAHDSAFDSSKHKEDTEELHRAFRDLVEINLRRVAKSWNLTLPEGA